MKSFGRKHPVITEIVITIAAFILALVFTAAGNALFGKTAEFSVAAGRLLSGFLFLFLFRNCLRNQKTGKGWKAAAPALIFAIWNFAYNIHGGMHFVRADQIPYACLLGLAPVVFEEVLFRGIFIHNLRESGRTPMLSVIISAAFFGLLHMTNIAGMSLVNALVQSGYAVVVGLLFGAVYIRTYDLLSVILAHAAIDIS